MEAMPNTNTKAFLSTIASAIGDGTTHGPPSSRWDGPTRAQYARNIWSWALDTIAARDASIAAAGAGGDQPGGDQPGGDERGDGNGDGGDNTQPDDDSPSDVDDDKALCSAVACSFGALLLLTALPAYCCLLLGLPDLHPAPVGSRDTHGGRIGIGQDLDSEGGRQEQVRHCPERAALDVRRPVSGGLSGPARLQHQRGLHLTVGALFFLRVWVPFLAYVGSPF